MPAPNRDLYVTTTLSVVIFTTVFCGGLTSPVLLATGMRTSGGAETGASTCDEAGGSGGSKGGEETYDPNRAYDPTEDSDDEAAPLVGDETAGSRRWARARERGATNWWRALDERYIKPTFGGSTQGSSDSPERARSKEAEVSFKPQPPMDYSAAQMSLRKPPSATGMPGKPAAKQAVKSQSAGP